MTINFAPIKINLRAAAERKENFIKEYHKRLAYFRLQEALSLENALDVIIAINDIHVEVNINEKLQNCQHKARPHRCGLGNIWSFGVEGIVFVEDEGAYSVALSREYVFYLLRTFILQRPILTETIIPEF
ncbi:3787_t:CDS:2 [Funneliformis geosporum]|uniref:3787_t:CDS:1 n=1 Tax=Funneliformis geosporum TaxID=1117311 RepID=A0A9W4T025_9GLOM|nr:3787_t:CDS:2 [Funneliformis geosporum]